MKDIKKTASKYFNEETVAGDVSVDADDVAMPMRRRRRLKDRECPIHKEMLEDGECPVCGMGYRE
jgi:hypothetical protein